MQHEIVIEAGRTESQYWRVVKRAAHFAGHCWHSVRKAVLRALAPFAPLFHRLGIVWRKNWRGIKGAARFGQACWRCEDEPATP